MSEIEKVKVKFTVKSWGGLNNKITPPQDLEMLMSKGEKLNEGSFGGFIGAGLTKAVVFELADINSEGVGVTTSGLVEESADGRINMLKSSRDLNFSIKFGRSLKLVTQSFDTGFSIIIAPIGIVTG